MIVNLNTFIFLKPHRNYKAAIYSIIIIALFFILNAVMIQEFIERKSIPAFYEVDLTQVLFIFLWFLSLISIVWTYNISKKTGRESGMWIILGLMTGPLALLIISFKDYKIRNFELAYIIKKTRLEYNQALKQAMQVKNNPESLQDLEQKYTQLLKERAVEIITKEKLGTLKELIDNGVINKDTDLNEKERLIKIVELNKINDTDIEEWNPDWAENDDLCPACGNSLDIYSNTCLNCGLKIK